MIGLAPTDKITPLPVAFIINFLLNGFLRYDFGRPAEWTLQGQIFFKQGDLSGDVIIVGGRRHVARFAFGMMCHIRTRQVMNGRFLLLRETWDGWYIR